MERTPDKNRIIYSSAPNVATITDRDSSIEKWINVRQKKKRMDEDSDGDTSQAREYRRQKTSCCSADDVNKNLIEFSKQMNGMNELLNALKEEQNARFLRMQSDMSEIKSQINDIRKANANIEKEVDYLGEKFVELEKARKDIIEDSKKQDNRIKDIFQKNAYLEKYNKALEERIMRLEYKELDTQIEIMNVQKQEGENLMATVSKIANELKMKIADIEKVWRVPGDSKVPRPLVVSLRSREARADWLKCKKIAITNDNLFNNGNSSRIYINEHVTRQTRQLFWSVKTRLKDMYKFIWVQNGKVLIKKSENEKIYQITFDSDIEAIIKKAED